MKDPVEIAVSGAIHQKRALRNTLAVPAHCWRRLAVLRGAGMSGTARKTHSAAPRVATASTMNTARQESTDSAAASGAVASKAPVPPATMIHPASEAWRSAGYQVAKALRGAIR